MILGLICNRSFSLSLPFLLSVSSPSAIFFSPYIRNLRSAPAHLRSSFSPKRAKITSYAGFFPSFFSSSFTFLSQSSLLPLSLSLNPLFFLSLSLSLNPLFFLSLTLSSKNFLFLILHYNMQYNQFGASNSYYNLIMLFFEVKKLKNTIRSPLLPPSFSSFLPSPPLLISTSLSSYFVLFSSIPFHLKD